MYDDGVYSHGLVLGSVLEWKHMGQYEEGLCRQKIPDTQHETTSYLFFAQHATPSVWRKTVSPHRLESIDPSNPDIALSHAALKRHTAD